MGWLDGYKDVDFSVLIGQTITAVIGGQDNNEIDFKTKDGKQFRMYHSQACCESVSVEEVIGDMQDLIGTPILSAECVSSSIPDSEEQAKHDESETWTFYKLATIKGSVTIRWYGSSNGYYSESVDFVEM